MNDSRNPAPGVAVYGVPRPKYHGLTMAQTAGMRRLTMEHCVLGAKPMVQPQKTTGGGLPPSIVHASRLPGHHRRRSPKMRPFNPIFQAPMPTQVLYRHRLGDGKLSTLRKLMVRIQQRGMQVDPGLDNKYEHLRESFLRCHSERRHELFRVEEHVVATCR